VAKPLGECTVLVVGAGGLGGAAALSLAGVGVGRLLVVDPASTTAADLTCGPALAEADLGRPRAEALAARAARLFPGVAVEPVVARFEAAGAAPLVARADLVLHASSDAEAAFAASDAAVAAGRPLVHGGVLALSAQILSVRPGETGCLRCLFEAPPPASVAGGAEAPVLGPLAGLVGALLGQEAERLLLGRPGAWTGQLLTYGARAGQGRLVPVARRPGCPACGSPAPSAGLAAGPPTEVAPAPKRRVEP